MSSRSKTATPAAVGARRRLKLLLIVMALFMSWATYTFYNQYGQLSAREAEWREADKKLADAQLKNESLKQEIERLNDKEYIGQIARKQHGMGLPGEKPIHIEKSSP